MNIKEHLEVSFRMDKIIKKFKGWKVNHPDKDYQYYDIHDFVYELSRGELLEVFEHIEKITE